MYVITSSYNQEHIWKGIKLITLVVIGTHYISRCKSNYHMIIHNKSPYSVRILVRVIVPRHQKKNSEKTKHGNTSVLCSKFSVIFKNDMICDIGLCHWAILTVNDCCLTPIDQFFRQEEVTF